MVTQNTLLRARKLKLHWFVALSSLPLLGVVAAFGFIPQSGTDSTPLKTVVTEIALPDESGSATSSPPTQTATFWRSIYVQQGDTINELLRRMNVQDTAAAEYLHNDQAATSLRKLPPGKAIQAETDADGSLLTLSYLDNNGNQITVEKNGADFKTSVLPAQLEHRQLMRTGEITSTLFAATDEADLPEPVADQLAEIFGGDIDFHRDLRKGDKFTVVYDMAYSNGEPVGTSRIQAAEFINQGKAYRVVYFQTGTGRGDYYTPEGKSVRKTFLRSPLEFSRVSSRFSLSRFHPVLGKWRAHKGVDYAASIGTKVKVTADGIVSFVGTQGGYGKVIMVTHQERYTTVYGHLSRFASGLRPGQRVEQGAVIGYVGKTGLASGPHLHYEFKINGQQRDPLRVALPNAAPIKNMQKTAFQEATGGLLARLGLLRNVNLARLD